MPHFQLGALAEHLVLAPAAAVDGAIAGMDPESQVILQMRFWNNKKVPEIATALGIEAKRLYKKIDRLLETLRAALEELVALVEQKSKNEPPTDPFGISEEELTRITN